MHYHTCIQVSPTSQQYIINIKIWLSTTLTKSYACVTYSNNGSITNRVPIKCEPKGFTQQPWAPTPSSKSQHQAWDNYRSPTSKPEIAFFTIINQISIKWKLMCLTPRSKPQHQAWDNYRWLTLKPVIASFTIINRVSFRVTKLKLRRKQLESKINILVLFLFVERSLAR